MSSELDAIAYKLYIDDRKKNDAYFIPECVFVTVSHIELSDFYKKAKIILRKKKINKLMKKCQ